MFNATLAWGIGQHFRSVSHSVHSRQLFKLLLSVLQTYEFTSFCAAFGYLHLAEKASITRGRYDVATTLKFSYFESG